MFDLCSHGYVAMTCPSCKGRPVAQSFAPSVAQAAAPAATYSRHYSGATLGARKELAGMWDDIMERATSQVERTQIRDGISSGALKRRQMEDDA